MEDFSLLYLVEKDPLKRALQRKYKYENTPVSFQLSDVH